MTGFLPRHYRVVAPESPGFRCAVRSGCEGIPSRNDRQQLPRFYYRRTGFSANEVLVRRTGSFSLRYRSLRCRFPTKTLDSRQKPWIGEPYCPFPTVFVMVSVVLNSCPRSFAAGYEGIGADECGDNQIGPPGSTLSSSL
jgi:hypothetical protein